MSYDSFSAKFASSFSLCRSIVQCGEFVTPANHWRKEEGTYVGKQTKENERFAKFVGKQCSNSEGENCVAWNVKLYG